ncbi:WbqC family protein [Paraburkholderia hospita]|uniref:WbqC family protein n=1 Tax=Paraburkholderia hospita TaxID=169430 RepID=UPI000B3468BA|nr:WbqC family protein [Paraburkholderia hospita]OUL88682.1 hypothetical protein CA601_18115 [Paraburkholderia hospita]
MKKIAILQSNYIPWKGYFDLIAAVDEFILYDDMQYTRRDWRNRNQIKTPQGVQWLTIPVQVKGKYHQKIRETEIDGTDWSSAHWKALAQNYRRSPHYAEIAEWLQPLYSSAPDRFLSALNRRFIEAVCNYLGIQTRITNSWDFTSMEGKTERLVDLCLQAGATEYISGPSAKDYIDDSMFSDNKVKLTWFEYSNYPVYPQLWGDFTHNVSIIDLLFNCGKDSGKYMKHLKSAPRAWAAS